MSERAVRRVYVPCMADHAYVLAAALRSSGVDACVLPATTTETVTEGLKRVIGNECLPCIATTGDIVSAVQSPDIDTEDAAFLMPTSPGPCKFGQYNKIQKLILARMGVSNVNLISPSARDSYGGLGKKLDRSFEILSWRGLVATDFLIQMKHQKRPFEQNAGEADSTFRFWLGRLVSEVEKGGKGLTRQLGDAARAFAAIRTDYDETRPLLCVIGEIYIRANAFCNKELDRKVEALGGEVFFVPVHEWFLYTNYRMKEDARWDRSISRSTAAHIKDRVMKACLKELARAAAPGLRRHFHFTVEEILQNALPYLNTYLGGEAALGAGWAVIAAENGFAGVINTSPFHCMPGAILQGVSKSIREDNGDIPWLNLWFDAQEALHVMTRLEAFMHQAAQYHRSRAPGPAVEAA